MIVQRIHHINALLAAQILLLVDDVKGFSRDFEAYHKYISQFVTTDDIGLFGCFTESGRLIGYLHAEQPHPTDPTRGFIILAAMHPLGSHTDSVEVLRQAKQWLADKGAKTAVMDTLRHPRAMERAFGFKLRPERTMEISTHVDKNT